MCAHVHIRNVASHKKKPISMMQFGRYFIQGEFPMQSDSFHFFAAEKMSMQIKFYGLPDTDRKFWIEEQNKQKIAQLRTSEQLMLTAHQHQ